jgi:hypothetical protein
MAGTNGKGRTGGKGVIFGRQFQKQRRGLAEKSKTVLRTEESGAAGDAENGKISEKWG